MTRSATTVLLRERGFAPKVNVFCKKLSNLGHVLSKPLQLKRVTEEVLGDFCDFAAK